MNIFQRSQGGIAMNDKNRRILLCVVLTALLVILLKPPAISGQHFKPILARIPPIIPESDLGKGKFLVASRDLIDPNFSQTVVLLLEYVPDGAMGVVINRPTKVKLSEVLPDMKELKQRPDTMYIGGPVSRNQMIMLVKSPSKPEASVKVFEDVFVCSSLKVVQALLNHTDKKERFRIYAGYTGWAPRQLDNEVARGDWHIFQADANTIFDKSSSDIWPDLIRRSSTKYVRAHY